MTENKETELNLLDLLLYLKKHLLILLAATIVFALAGFVYTKVFVTPTYTASTRMYVLTKTYEDKVVTSDIQISTYLNKDCEILITGKNVTSKVIEELGLNMSPGALAGKITVTVPENTRVLQIDIVDTDPQRAAAIANCVREVASQQFKEIMDVEAVRTVYEADVPGGPSAPNAQRNAILGGLIGLVLAIAIFAVIFMLDDTIRTEDDVTHYLGLPVLGVIPSSSELNDAAPKGRKSKKAHTK